MTLTSGITERIPSMNERTKVRTVATLSLACLLIAGMSGMAAAASSTSTSFLCGSGGTTFTDTISNVMTLFVVGGPVIGTLVAVYFQIALAGSPDGGHEEDRNNALKYGWSVPLLVYVTDVISGAVLGIDLSCIIP